MAASLDDKYLREQGGVFLSGTQALVRLALDQRRRDQRSGLRTAGFVSGYRGSPLGGLDLALWQASRLLSDHDIRFEPGLNEELAATAVAGSQQTGIVGASRYDGVFGIWYAKNPGLDRAGDAIKHANAAGTSPGGGVLAVSGDDPGATSSSLPNQCEFTFIAASMPVLAPSNVAELLELGLLGISLSRYCGLWVGFKAVADVVESSASIELAPDRPRIVLPQEFETAPGGLGIRWPDSRWDQDRRLIERRLPAAKAFARANRLDGIVFGAERPRIGIVTAGKAYQDVREALSQLGIDEPLAREIGLAVYKVGMPWPLEPEAMMRFAQGLNELLVVEERREVIESQLKSLAYNLPAATRPLIVGKTDETGSELIPTVVELSPRIVAQAIGKRIGRFSPPRTVLDRLAAIHAGMRAVPAANDSSRVPHFCAGCPHARSTRVPDGSFAMAGIGCHSLRIWMGDSATKFLMQMGGEGANWIGLAPFVDANHVFQNLGDGTYTHSGSLAVRAAVAAGRNITFRILYNEAVAMTGGQPVEGAPTVPQITRQLDAEGVRRIAVVSDEPGKYRSSAGFAPGVKVHHRDELDALQREMRDAPGVTAIVYDQVCATEKRRRRKRGEAAAAPVRVFINERVCEGCGDCVEQSQCAAVLPVETPLGRKRRIDQSACNVDLSCLDGFCPSFVTIDHAVPRRAAPAEFAFDAPPAPLQQALDQPNDILVDGIGGTGVITVGAVLAMAAHLEGRGCSTLDSTGISRKGGAVSTHLRIAPRPEDLHVTRIPEGGAKLLLACDMVVSAGGASLARIGRGRTRVIANADVAPTQDQRLDPESEIDFLPLRGALIEAAGEDGCEFVHATAIAERLLGDSIYANMVLLGFANQKGLLSVGESSIDEAITLNGNDIEANRRAFALGRIAAHDGARVDRFLRSLEAAQPDKTLDGLIAYRADFLAAYQDAAYARRYREFVERVRSAERRVRPAEGGVRPECEQLATAAARGYFKLLAIKDEYEVARLYSDGGFARELALRFEGNPRVRYHLAPPLFARRDPLTGKLRKMRFGPWMGSALALVARFKRLRGTVLDPFGHTAARRMERRLISEYEAVMQKVLSGLNEANFDAVLEIASLPETMRGYGHVKARNVALAKKREAELLAAFGRSTP